MWLSAIESSVAYSKCHFAWSYTEYRFCFQCTFFVESYTWIILQVASCLLAKRCFTMQRKWPILHASPTCFRDEHLSAHIKFLESQGIAGVSHHSLLFSKAAPVQAGQGEEEVIRWAYLLLPFPTWGLT